MDNLSQEQRERVNNLWGEVAQLRVNQRGAALHSGMVELCKELVELLPNDMHASRCYVTALIKSKNFEVARKFIEKSKVSDDLKYELAYIYHREGNNKDALHFIEKVSATDEVSE